jgi:hypothetical protein
MFDHHNTACTPNNHSSNTQGWGMVVGFHPMQKVKWLYSTMMYFKKESVLSTGFEVALDDEG